MGRRQTELELAQRYAAALFELVQDSGAVDQTSEQLSALSQSIVENAELGRVVENPTLSREEATAVVVGILNELKAGEALINFAKVAGRNRRLSLIPYVSQSFKALLAEKNGQVTAIVTTASDVKKRHIEGLQKSLEKNLDRKISVETIVDSKILGGITIQVGSQFFDASLSGKLTRLKSSQQKVTA